MIKKVFFCMVCVAIGGTNAGAQKSEIWKPDAAAVNRLGKPVRIGDITVRPPIGFKYNKTIDRKEVIHSWAGREIIPSEPFDGFIVSTTDLSSEDKAQMETVAIKDIANLYARNFLKSWTGGKITPWYSGTINGVSFVRAAWWATNSSGIKGRGQFYVAIYKGTPYILSCVEKDVGKGTQILYISDEAARSFAPVK